MEVGKKIRVRMDPGGGWGLGDLGRVQGGKGRDRRQRGREVRSRDLAREQLARRTFARRPSPLMDRPPPSPDHYSALPTSPRPGTPPLVPPFHLPASPSRASPSFIPSKRRCLRPRSLEIIRLRSPLRRRNGGRIQLHRQRLHPFLLPRQRSHSQPSLYGSSQPPPDPVERTYARSRHQAPPVSSPPHSPISPALVLPSSRSLDPPSPPRANPSPQPHISPAYPLLHSNERISRARARFLDRARERRPNWW